MSQSREQPILAGQQSETFDYEKGRKLISALIEQQKKKDEISDHDISTLKTFDRFIQVWVSEQHDCPDIFRQWLMLRLMLISSYNMAQEIEGLAKILEDKNVLDRIIFGKGSSDYQKKSASYASTGMQLVEHIFTA